MNVQKFFLNGVVISSLIFVFCCAGNKQVAFQEETKEVNYIPYYLKVYEADSLYLTGNYDHSFQILDSLFKEYEPLNFGIYEEYETYIKLSQQLYKKTNFKVLISDLISNYGKRIDEIEQDSILNIVYRNSKLDKNQYEYLRKKYLNSLNMPLRDSILKIYDRDQSVRAGNNISNIEKVDLYNQGELVKLISKYGFPSVQKIGVKSLEQGKYDPIDISEVWLHMMDYDGKEKDFIFKQIEKAVNEGKCDPLTLSLILDRDNRRANKTKSAYYYGLNTSNINLSKDELIKVNSRRRQIGLPTFEFEKWKMKIYWGN